MSDDPVKEILTDAILANHWEQRAWERQMWEWFGRSPELERFPIRLTIS